MIIWAAMGAIAISFGISVLATPLSRSVACRLGMLDVPGHHKAHAMPVPLLGGSAIFAAILGPALLVLALARIWAADFRGAPAWRSTSTQLSGSFWSAARSTRYSCALPTRSAGWPTSLAGSVAPGVEGARTACANAVAARRLATSAMLTTDSDS